MDLKEYYQKLNDQKNLIFTKSLNNNKLLGLSHDLIVNINDWFKITENNSSISLLKKAIEQIDISCLHILDGLYRSGFTSLRLSLEMITGTIYFTANNLEFEEWLKGGYDLNWSTIMDEDNGVLSPRFSNAYFPECTPIRGKYNIRTKKLYRDLSEMVHGNHSTWKFDDPSICIDTSLIKSYTLALEELSVILNFQMSLRFLSSLTPDQISVVETHINDSLGTEDIIRKKIGGTI